MARFSEASLLTATEIISRYPRPKSALIPLLHLAQEQDGWLTEDAMEHIAELIGLTPAGHLAAAASRLAWFIKGQVKRTPMIWDAVTRARRLRGKPVAAD